MWMEVVLSGAQAQLAFKVPQAANEQGLAWRGEMMCCCSAGL